MPERTRLRAGEVGFDTESFVREMALDIVTGHCMEQPRLRRKTRRAAIAGQRSRAASRGEMDLFARFISQAA